MSVDVDPASTPLHKHSTFPRSIGDLVTKQLTSSNMAKSRALLQNMDVDYVIVFRFTPEEQKTAAENFDLLVRKLADAGLASEVRQGEQNSLLILVKVASADHMFAEIYRSRVKDWIHGVRSAEPARDVKASLDEDPLTDAERLRIIYQLITNDEQEGGAGIRPQVGTWKNVESIFALHDHLYNKTWISKWSTSWQLHTEDLDDIRNRFGEKVAYYFAFEQTYFNFLIFPSALGIFAWFFLRSFSPLYAVASCLWCVVFVEWWKHKESDLAIRWGVRGVSSIESKRHNFRPTVEIQDPATGVTQKIFPATERLQRQLLQLPFVLTALAVLGGLIALCFAIEIFIGEVYDGPGKSLLNFLPTIILTTCLPLLTTILSKIAERLNNYENYETDSQYDRHLTSKHFVLNFITSYLGIILTAFVYIPFGAILVPYLDVFNVATRQLANTESKVPAKYSIKPERLQSQVFYFAVTASIINFAMEVIVPYVKRQGLLKFRQIKAHRRSVTGISTPSHAEDAPEEKEFLQRVRGESELPAYDVATDLREMVIQFGYLSLFSVVWPLVPLSFLINNWFELRADAVKICVEMQRPTPWRADTIGPWLDALEFITWLGSVTTAAVTYMFSNDGVGPDGTPHDLKGWSLLLSIFFSEHIYLFVHWLVAAAIANVDSPGRQKERRDRYLVRQQYFEESLSKIQNVRSISLADQKDVLISRTSLEEDARKESLNTTTPTERFWSRQRGWREAAKMGRIYMERFCAENEKSPREKKEL